MVEGPFKGQELPAARQYLVVEVLVAADDHGAIFDQLRKAIEDVEGAVVINALPATLRFGYEEAKK